MELEPPSIVITDSTLRDGEQTPGIAFNLDEKVAIALALEQAGVDEIEVGIPAMGDEEVAAIAQVGQALSHATAMCWGRMTRLDVDAAVRTGLKRVSLSVPVSDLMIKAKLRGERSLVKSRIREIVPYALDHGLQVAMGGEDSSRGDLDFICEVIGEAEKAGVHRFRFADTVGFLDPFRTCTIFQRLRRDTNMALEFHGHDDLGLATANTLAAVKGGATWASVCVLGLGERAGNAALEEVATVLHRVTNFKTNIIFEKLPALADLVARASRRAIPPNKPIVGEAVFSHESGIHVDGLLKNAETYEALPPSMFGRERHLVLGRHSGKAAILNALQSLGLPHDDEEHTKHVLEQVRQHAAATKRAVTTDELREFHAKASVALSDSSSHSGHVETKKAEAAAGSSHS
jgi:homocitrate synthase NifV